ncbi:type III PLP-dependent enzyme [Nocardia bhagyanarayanae]|uniref:Diaminopimelate decarboxylase n=1 Tax=Nocardia bhagyanarayanae TaxID=1215925 RepID=A0A543EXK1_9NOCA|nr:type III PLP-dependent enzyme [Nocardia bhagyanarayanae]TQM26305.1 diaminopimelate decarboxylase [Nocardia bhagyanarayanae]
MSGLSAPVRECVETLDAAELPAYIYDLGALRAHAAAIRAALPDSVELYYAAKANPEPEILRALADLVDGYEVSSGGELAHVAATVPNRPLAFGGPGKSPDELAAAFAHGVHRVHVESIGELRRLAALSTPDEPIGVLLRVNLPLADRTLSGSALAMGGRPTPFGLDPGQAELAAAALARGSFPGLRWHGVHAHLASGLEAADLVAVAESIVDWSIGLAARHGAELAEVNVGGGMNVDYTAPDRRFDWAAYGAGLDRIADARPGLRLRIEPGRALTAYSGWYVTEVLDVKPSHRAEFAIVRGGTHHLRTPAAKGHDQPCSIVPTEHWPYPWPRAATTTERVTVTGQLCTPKDVLAQDVPVSTLRTGDRIAFDLAGAYAWNISHRDFLMHPAPSFHFLRGARTAEGGGE